MPVQVINRSQNTILAERCDVADTPLTRMRGLLGQRTLSSGHGLCITACQSIHMLFMAFAIDAVFIDQEGRVVGLCEGIQPFQLSPIFWKAKSVIELPVGTIQLTQTKLGDIVEIKN